MVRVEIKMIGSLREIVMVQMNYCMIYQGYLYKSTTLMKDHEIYYVSKYLWHIKGWLS